MTETASEQISVCCGALLSDGMYPYCMACGADHGLLVDSVKAAQAQGWKTPATRALWRQLDPIQREAYAPARA